jgi:hypothetical protein
LGFFGLPLSIRLSLAVRITFLSGTGSTKGSMSFLLPHEAVCQQKYFLYGRNLLRMGKIRFIFKTRNDMMVRKRLNYLRCRDVPQGYIGQYLVE